MKRTIELENMIEQDENTLGSIRLNTKSGKILLDNLIKENGYTNSKIGNDLGISNYIYEITSLKNNKQVSRNILLAILIYIGADLDTIDEILQLFGYSKIYVKVEYDAYLYHCINSKFSFEQTNVFLIENGLAPLL